MCPIFAFPAGTMPCFASCSRTWNCTWASAAADSSPWSESRDAVAAASTKSTMRAGSYDSALNRRSKSSPEAEVRPNRALRIWRWALARSIKRSWAVRRSSLSSNRMLPTRYASRAIRYTLRHAGVISEHRLGAGERGNQVMLGCEPR